jgi:hypothetical protein
MRKERYRRRLIQLDLFQPVPTRPTWRTLPPSVRQRVPRLLARLLAEHHAARPATPDVKGVRDE